MLRSTSSPRPTSPRQTLSMFPPAFKSTSSYPSYPAHTSSPTHKKKQNQPLQCFPTKKVIHSSTGGPNRMCAGKFRNGNPCTYSAKVGNMCQHHCQKPTDVQRSSYHHQQVAPVILQHKKLTSSPQSLRNNNNSTSLLSKSSPRTVSSKTPMSPRSSNLKIQERKYFSPPCSPRKK